MRKPVVLFLPLVVVMVFSASFAPFPRAARAQGEAGVQHGMRVLSLRLSGAGKMLDLRYDVTDAARAGEILNKGTRAYLVHDNTGAVLGVPSMGKVGRLQQTRNPPLPGPVYFMIFENLRSLAKKGDTLTLVIGDVYFEGLKVE